MREARRIAELEREFGRKIESGEVKCSGCNGVGFNQFESECEGCEGRGHRTELVFAECGHSVESEECINEGCTRCITTECENLREPNQDRCKECLDNAAYWKRQYDAEHRHEPYTREEIMDCYSDPTEHAKRDILLSYLGDK
jgi:hypothetical protein